MALSGTTYGQSGSDPEPREKRFDSSYSKKELGCVVKKEGTIFRLFAPRATRVTLVLFQYHDDDKGEEVPMVRDTDGVWEYLSLGRLYGRYYGYRIEGPGGDGEMFDSSLVVADPYSRSVVTKNHYRQPAKTLIVDTKYNWEGDTFTAPANHGDLIIYEAHIRDLTAHASSDITPGGTYVGLTLSGKRGGLSYLKKLGVNAVEFLPIQKFGNLEIPYGDSSVTTEDGEFNSWNPYERNHWGYMTSYFFAPENYYAAGGTMAAGEYNGTGGGAVKELKGLVKALHREGISVIMDVVYSHVSHYDYNPLKYIDKFYYFHTSPEGKFLKNSGCGNDLNTSRPMVRRMIVENIKYWMKEFHVDGFRFDLAAMIDRETCKEIAAEAKKINPNVILIAEPWGGGKYDPRGFSEIGWASWNDRFRNGVKGENPNDGLGFIFGKFRGNDSKESVMSYLMGTLREDGGLFAKKEQSVNYLESHDGYTLGDFIRLGLGTSKEDEKIEDIVKHITLDPDQLALNKLAAMFLFVSQGPVMIHEGQEYARSKVIAPTGVPDPRIGTIDDNSYNKDNGTNYINYYHSEINRELFEYYAGLIELRKKYQIFGSAPKEVVEFMKTDDSLVIAFRLDGRKAKSIKGKEIFIVILNADRSRKAEVVLPAGTWSVIADGSQVSLKRPVKRLSGRAAVPPTSGMILMKAE